MCDYSLELVASRPAKVGDKLVSAGFPHTITRGFVSVDDPNVAVCVLPGTELAFEQEVQCETGVLFAWRLGHKVARFRQVNKGRSNAHHDALEFPDGKTVLLTQLCHRAAIAGHFDFDCKRSAEARFAGGVAGPSKVRGGTVLTIVSHDPDDHVGACDVINYPSGYIGHR
jgi:hypothetical protein